MKNRKGFSLAELLVVMAIISIMTVAVLISYANSRKLNAINVSGRNFAAIVRELQNNALNGKQSVSGIVVCGYGFHISGSAPFYTYDLYYNSYVPAPNTDCNSVGKGFGNPTHVYSAGNSFGNNVTISAATGAYFTLPGGAIYSDTYSASGTPLSSPFQINLSLSSLNYPICLYAGGRVEEPGIGKSCP